MSAFAYVKTQSAIFLDLLLFWSAGSNEKAQTDLLKSDNTSLNTTVNQLGKCLNDKKMETHKIGITACHQNQSTVLVSWPVLRTRQFLEKESRF